MLVAIGHKIRRGKDTAAGVLVRELGYKKINFADKLKELAYEANPIVLAQDAFVNVQIGTNTTRALVDRYGWEYVKDHYPLARKFLQDLGQAGRKVFGEDFWFDQWMAAVSGDTVVADLRFRNEAMRLREAGALLIRIDRVAPGLPDDPDGSEHDLDEWDDWDLVVLNNGSITDLEKQVLDFVKAARPKLELDL